MKNKYVEKALKRTEYLTKMIKGAFKMKELNKIKSYKKKPRNKTNKIWKKIKKNARFKPRTN